MTQNYTHDPGAVLKVADSALGILRSTARTGRNLISRSFDKAITSIDPEVATHLINSNKEILLAFRSLLDHELRMADQAREKVQQHARHAPPDEVDEFVQPT